MRRFRNTILPLFFFAVFFGSALLDAAPVRLRSIWASGRRSVHLLDAASGLGAAVSRSASQIALTRGKERLLFYPGRRYASFNSVRVNLCYPLLMQKTNPYLAKVDYDNLLVPFLGTRLPYKHKISRIVIDPGHGGADIGCSAGKDQEHAIAHDIAQHAAALLRAAGCEVRLTRAASWPAVLPGQPHLVQSTRLALRVQASLLRLPGTPADRGVKHAYFKVLREVPAPAILVETGFITNPEDRARLASPEGRQNLGFAIALGVLDAFAR